MYDVIVIGSGPAGMMASIMASKKHKVLLLEKNDISGKKLLITGGGRCNLTNLKPNKEFLDVIEYNKKFLYSTINNFGPSDIYNYFTKHGVKLKEEEDNKIFPVSNKSNEILRCLMDQMKNVNIHYHEAVKDISVDDDYKTIITNKDTYKTKNLIIATGGSSYKNTGSTGDNLVFARKLNQPIVKIFPAEASIITSDNFSFLAGISLNEVIIKYKKKKVIGNMLFTHRGLSGSSIMKVSEFVYLDNVKELFIDLLPNITKDEFISLINKYDREKEFISFLSDLLPKKLSNYILDINNMNIKIKSSNNKMLQKLMDSIKNFKVNIKCVDNIDAAYVTGGGIDMNYIDSKTMESKLHKGIYFVGEALDIHGPIGGYNITLALSTGYTAGISIK